MSYDVFYTAKARDDLEEIYEYIAFSLQEPVTAGKMYQNIIAAVHTLKTFPLRNALYENEPWRSRGLRKLPVKNFLVFYTVNEEKNAVRIIRIMYGARDLEKHLNES
ncbi:MAG: type II toxin-antitoxin system RelE/ParE family toxin [Clostridia bacterium]|nr:type II toxin-antitoxin system RelE/ParE family toxin [Clostridia bacterium]